MSILKRLISDTAIYGVSSVLARGLNYILTIFFGKVFLPEEFGIFTELYAYTGFLLVVLTHGMETSFFRHYNLSEHKDNAFSVAYTSILSFVVPFVFIGCLFVNPISTLVNYTDHPEYIRWFVLIITFDVLSALPFAFLRATLKAKKFAALKVLNVTLLIFFNLFFLILCPYLYSIDKLFILEKIYNPEIKIGYVFISNVIASACTFIFLIPELRYFKFVIDRRLYKKMISYAIPIMLVGLAGSLNEFFDRIMLRRLLPYDDTENLRQLGLYGFNYKLSMLMTMLIQAFRFAAEPLFFKEASNRSAPKTYAIVTKYFALVGGIVFLAVSLFAKDIVTLVNVDYLEGVGIVPVLLMANCFLGVYFNIATWYKVSDKTSYGALIAVFGAIFTVVLNLLFIPKFGYWASAYITLGCYFLMCFLGVYFGNRYYPIPYDFKRITLFLIFPLVVYLLLNQLVVLEPCYWQHMILKFVVIFLTVFLLYKADSQKEY